MPDCEELYHKSWNLEDVLQSITGYQTFISDQIKLIPRICWNQIIRKSYAINQQITTEFLFTCGYKDSAVFEYLSLSEKDYDLFSSIK